MKTTEIDNLEKTINSSLAAGVKSSTIRFNQLTIEVEIEDINKTILFLKTNEKCKFRQLIDITAVDYPERERRFNEMKENFYDDNNLTVLPNGNLRDENFEEYELEEERGDFIVYKPEGMRGKRAYIKTDGENYLAWSGPIKTADKSKFLRGDLDKI